jgi:hypothetical protein
MRLASASAALLPFRSAAENEKIPMPYSSYRPDLMGSATLMPGGSFEAGSLQSFELVFVAGTFGIDDTRSIKIGFRFATDFGPVQFADPCGQGFTTAEASNGATLELRWEYKRNIRPWSRSLYIGVTGSFLRPGDTVTVRFGDRRQGSPGIRLQTYCEEAFEFRLFVDAFAMPPMILCPAGKPSNRDRPWTGGDLADHRADMPANGHVLSRGHHRAGQMGKRDASSGGHTRDIVKPADCRAACVDHSEGRNVRGANRETHAP